MDRTTFYRWFRQTAGHLGVPDINLRFMRPGESGRELGRYEPASNMISIDERVLQNDNLAVQAALHEFAHAIVYKKNSGYFEKKDGKLQYDPNNPLAEYNLRKLELKGGHGGEWRGVATNLGVNVNTYIDKEDISPPSWKIRRGLGFK